MIQRLTEVLILVCSFSAVLLAENAREVYQRALVQEQGAGNLRQAIDLYERAAKDAGQDRTLAAKALVHAAGCYGKLGEPKAAELYAEVVRGYPEQRESVAAAQTALTTLTRGKPARQQTISSSLSGQLTAVVGPVLDEYCIGCHNQTRKVAGLALDGIRDRLNSSPSSLTADAEIWEKVLTRLRSRTMPPSGQHHPDAATNQSMIKVLESALDWGYPEPVSSGDRASDGEVAVRLARLVWNSDPDQVLLDAAKRGLLRDSAVLQQQVRRMLSDPKSEQLAANFFDPWLHLGAITSGALTTGSPAELDDQLRQSMRRETQLFIHSQIREDHPAIDLWTSNYTYVNDRLAQYYGMSDISGNQFRRVARTGTLRSGLLGQASILTLTSMYNPRSGAARTSIAMRGKWFYTAFFGLSVPPPPPSVSPLDQDGMPTANLRMRMENHHKNPSCASCHQIFDPFGTALENFDVIGRFREQDGGQPIDASGTFADGVRWSDMVQFRQALLQYQDSFVTNITEVLLSYALERTRHANDSSSTPGRFLHAGEMPAVRAILRDAAASNYSWSSIIAGIVSSPPFQMKTVVP
jgi:hypothetical protein